MFKYNFFVFRWTYIEFYSRYSILMSHVEADLSDKKQTCKNVLQRLIQVSCLSCLLLKSLLKLHIHVSLLVFIARTPTSTSLAVRRSSSEPVR